MGTTMYLCRSRNVLTLGHSFEKRKQLNQARTFDRTYLSWCFLPKEYWFYSA